MIVFLFIIRFMSFSNLHTGLVTKLKQNKKLFPDKKTFFKSKDLLSPV